jgi:hypothetical protein
MIYRTTKNKLTDNQKKITAKIAREWPNATIREHDAGCFKTTVQGGLLAVSQMFPSSLYGVVVMPSPSGGVQIQW